MTIGAQFLERVLNEAAAEDRDGVKDGFNIPLDSQARAMAAKLKLPFAKRLIAFHFMCGVPGRYMNTADVTEAVQGAADMLRKKVSVRRAFTTFYEGLAAAKGFNIPSDDVGAVQEAKKLVDPAKIEKAKDAVKKAKKDLADHVKTYDGGSGMREKALRAAIEKAEGSLKKLKEEVELNEAKTKRGGFIQKLLEAVLNGLGLPEELTATTGPSAVGTGIYRTAELVEADSNLERALRLLASRMGVRGTDTEEDEPVTEAVDVGNDAYSQAVMQLVSALGIPDDILERRRTQIISALRERKATLGGRPQIMTLMTRLNDMIAKNTTKSGQESDDDVNEATNNDWILDLDWKKHNFTNKSKMPSELNAKSEIIIKTRNNKTRAGKAGDFGWSYEDPKVAMQSHVDTDNDIVGYALRDSKKMKKESDSRFSRLSALSEARIPEFFDFGFEDKNNAKAAEAALKDAGIKYKKSSNMGIYYFDFDDKQSRSKGLKVVKDVIDHSLESEWPAPRKKTTK